MLSEEFNAAAAWQQWELAAHGLLHVLPPLAQDFLARRRRRHWKRTSDVTRALARATRCGARCTRAWMPPARARLLRRVLARGLTSANIAAAALPRPTPARRPSAAAATVAAAAGRSASLQPASPPSDAPMQPFQLQLDPRRLDRHNGANGGSPRADDVKAVARGNGGKATAATPALATPAPAPAAAAEPTLLASSPSDGWLPESRSARLRRRRVRVGDGGSKATATGHSRSRISSARRATAGRAAAARRRAGRLPPVGPGPRSARRRRRRRQRRHAPARRPRPVRPRVWRPLRLRLGRRTAARQLVGPRPRARTRGPCAAAARRRRRRRIVEPRVAPAVPLRQRHVLVSAPPRDGRLCRVRRHGRCAGRRRRGVRRVRQRQASPRRSLVALVAFAAA